MNSTQFQSLLSQSSAIWLIQMSLVIAPIIDTYMLAQLSTQEVATMALGSAFYFWVLITCKGTLQGVCYASAEAIGQGDDSLAYRYLIQSGWLWIISTLIAWCTLAVSVVFIQHLDISEVLQQNSASYLLIIALGIPASLLLKVFSSFFEGVSQPIVITFWLWLGILVKVMLNYCLLSGWLGSEWQNANGTALSTVIMNWTITLCVLWWLRHKVGDILLNISQNHGFLPDWTLIKRLLSYGLPIGVGFFAEFSTAPAISSMIATHSEQLLAAHQVLLSVTDMVFGFAIAFTIASSVMVGQMLQSNPTMVGRFSQNAERMLISFMLIAGVLVWLSSGLWTPHYVPDDSQLSALVATAVIAMWFRNTVESGQTLMGFYLRAIDKGWIVVLINSVILWSVGVGGIWLLDYFDKLTLANIWWTLGLAFLLAWVTLRGRYYRLLQAQKLG